MCCRRDSSASATSGFWPIAVAALRCRSVYNYSPNQTPLGRKPSLKKKLIPHHDLFGFVRDVAGQWSSSNDSVPLSFDCGLRQFPPHDNHDTIFLITASALSQIPAL
jgi:hypothetical protein